MPWGASTEFVASYAGREAKIKLPDEMIIRAAANQPSRAREQARKKICQLISDKLYKREYHKKPKHFKWNYLRLRKSKPH